MSTDKLQKPPIAVCAAVLEHCGKVLLTLRPLDKQQGGFWEFPGGKIEAGESAQQALKRELQEELAIEINVGPLFATIFHRYAWGTVQIFAYSCSWQAGEIKHLEVADHAWVAPERLPDFNILPADQPIIEKLSAAAGK